MRQLSQNLVGKTIAGVVARPGPGGAPVALMLRFEDGSCIELVTPRGERALKRMLSASAVPGPARTQLALAV